MFWERFYNLCIEVGKKPSKVCEELGFSNATATKWKKGSIPGTDALNKISKYFDVSTSYLLGHEDDKKKSSGSAELGEKDRKLIEAYHRSEPVIQSTVDKLLGIEEKTITVKIAARDGTYEEKTITEEEWNKIKDLPDADL